MRDDSTLGKLFFWLRYHPNVAGLVGFTIIIGFTLAVGILFHRLDSQNQLSEINRLSRTIEDRVGQTLAYSELAAMTMAQLVTSDSIVPGFDSVAQVLVSSSEYLDGVQMVHKGVITQVYPFEENKTVLGYDIKSKPVIWKEAQKAIDQKQMYFAGPLNLKQGGQGIVGRLPVYRDGEFWGFSAVLIRLERFLKNTGLDNAQGKYTFQLSKTNIDSQTEEFFITDGGEKNISKATKKIAFPNTGWQVYIINNPDASGQIRVAIIGFFGFIFACAMGYLIRTLFVRGKDLAEAHQELNWQHKETMDSVISARYLQQSVMHSEADLLKQFPKSFLLLKPRDEVSGDFFWVHSTPSYRFVAVVDCTGHGVRAGLVSMMAVQMLYRIVVVEGHTSPAKILQLLDHAVTETLQRDESAALMDGMDMILCVMDRGTNDLKFSGAQRPLYVYRHGLIEELRGSRFAIGGHTYSAKTKVFDECKLTLENGDKIYLTSDGYHSQFGGANDKKLGKARLRKWLQDVAELGVDEQKAELDKRLLLWQGEKIQIDDILLLGIEI